MLGPDKPTLDKLLAAAKRRNNWWFTHWYKTGHNNALDGKFWPPQSVGMLNNWVYRIGWISRGLRKH